MAEKMTIQNARVEAEVYEKLTQLAQANPQAAHAIREALGIQVSHAPKDLSESLAGAASEYLNLVNTIGTHWQGAWRYMAALSSRPFLPDTLATLYYVHKSVRDLPSQMMEIPQQLYNGLVNGENVAASAIHELTQAMNRLETAIARNDPSTIKQEAQTAAWTLAQLKAQLVVNVALERGGAGMARRPIQSGAVPYRLPRTTGFMPPWSPVAVGVAGGSVAVSVSAEQAAWLKLLQVLGVVQETAMPVVGAMAMAASEKPHLRVVTPEESLGALEVEGRSIAEWYDLWERNRGSVFDMAFEAAVPESTIHRIKACPEFRQYRNHKAPRTFRGKVQERGGPRLTPDQVKQLPLTSKLHPYLKIDEMKLRGGDLFLKVSVFRDKAAMAELMALFESCKQETVQLGTGVRVPVTMLPQIKTIEDVRTLTPTKIGLAPQPTPASSRPAPSSLSPQRPSFPVPKGEYVFNNAKWESLVAKDPTLTHVARQQEGWYILEETRLTPQQINNLEEWVLANQFQ